MARIKVNKADIRWLLLDRSAPQYAGLRTASSARHVLTATRDGRGNAFGETVSDDGALGLVKIAGADAAWRSANDIEGPGRNAAILDVFDGRDHSRAVMLVNDRNENGTKKPEAQWNWTNQWSEARKTA